MQVLITVPRVVPSQNELENGKYRNDHAYKALRDGWQSDIFHIVGRKNTQLLRAHKDLKHRAKVLIFSQRKRLIDKSNLWGGIKPILDCLTRLEYIVDDSEKWIDLEVAQEKSPDLQTVISITYEGN